MVYDVAIIGGGVVGCAILQQLSRNGYQCILLEKEAQLISGASSGNSGMAHNGFDGDPGSLDGQCLAKARTLNQHFYSTIASNIPYRNTGAIIVAWTQGEYCRLAGIVNHAHAAGVGEVRQLTRGEVLEMEPSLSPRLLGGVWVPGEACVDSWLAPVMMAHRARRAGAKIVCDSEVTSGQQTSDGTWQLGTLSGPVSAKVVINAAGLYGDLVENISHRPQFKITPKRGQYAVFSNSAGSLLKHIILPVPQQETKGIIVFPTVYNNIVVGPTMEEVDCRENPKVEQDVIDKLVKFAHSVVPALKEHQVVATYAGVRPATQYKDYQIYANKQRGWVTVGGIRSTGVSACLAIAELVQDKVHREIGVQPSTSLPLPLDEAIPYWCTDRGTVVMDGAEYTVTHPISKIGIWGTKAKL